MCGGRWVRQSTCLSVSSWKGADDPEEEHLIVGWQAGAAKADLIKQGEEKVLENYKRGQSTTWRPPLKYISLYPASIGNRVVEI